MNKLAFFNGHLASTLLSAMRSYCYSSEHWESAELRKLPFFFFYLSNALVSNQIFTSHHRCAVGSPHDADGTALSMSAKSTGAASVGFQLLHVIHRFSARKDGVSPAGPPHCPVSRLPFLQKIKLLKKMRLGPIKQKKRRTRTRWVPFPGVGQTLQGDGWPSCLQWHFI